jgi:RNA polymerase sigma-70 factor, ECF subfamily
VPKSPRPTKGREPTPTSGVEPTASPDAPELVARIRGGDRAAEEELVGRYGRPLAVLLRRATHDPVLADDLRQDVFRLALIKIRGGELRDPTRLAGFLAGLARNLAVDHFRHQKIARRSIGIDSLRDEAAPHANPLELLLARERADLARRLLDELGSERDRLILTRFYVAEEPKDAICADLGLTSLQFNRVLFRARERYRELYERAVREMRAKGR